MKVIGIILLIFAALNFIVAMVAAGNGATDAAAQKIGASFLLAVIGGLLWSFGKKKNENKQQDKSSSLPQSDHKNESVEKLLLDDGSESEALSSATKNVHHADVETIEDNNRIDVGDEDSIDNEEMDYPKPLDEPLTPSDLNRLMTEFQDQMLAIMSDGGTKEQSQIKMEILLGKRTKTEAMLAVEDELRKFFKEYYKAHGEKLLNNADNNPVLKKIAVATGLLQAHQQLNNGEESEERKKMCEIANSYGISIHLLDDEEYNRALSIYKDGKQSE